MESGETDPEFEAILDQVDPNRYSFRNTILCLSLVVQFCPIFTINVEILAVHLI